MWSSYDLSDVPMPFNVDLATHLGGVVPAMLVQYVLYNTTLGYRSTEEHSIQKKWKVPLNFGTLTQRFPKVDIRTFKKYIKEMVMNTILLEEDNEFTVNMQHQLIIQTYHGHKNFDFVTEYKNYKTKQEREQALQKDNPGPLLYFPNTAYAANYGINCAVIMDRIFFLFQKAASEKFPIRFVPQYQMLCIYLSKKDIEELFPFFGNPHKRLKHMIENTDHLKKFPKSIYGLNIANIDETKASYYFQKIQELQGLPK